MQDGHDPLLHPWLEVDEQVSAADQVHAAERRVPGHVVSCEDAHVAEGLDHPVAAVHLGEEPLQAGRRDVLGDLREVVSRPRFLHGALGKVGAEYLEGGARPLLSRGFQQADDDRVDLLAGGATGHPHSQRRAGRPILQQARQHLARQHLEDARVSEEGSDRDQALLMQGLRLVRVGLEVARVLFERLDVGERHATCDPPLDRRRLVRAEIGAGRPAEQGQDRAQAILRLRRLGRLLVSALVALRDHVGMAAEASELLRDASRRLDEVDAPRGDGAARHAVMRGRLKVLGEDDAAFRLDRPRSKRPVRAGPGEDHGDRLAAPGLGQRAQEGVDRQVSARGGDARDQLQHVTFDGDVVAPGGDIDVIGLDRRVPLDLGDRHSASLGQ